MGKGIGRSIQGATWSAAIGLWAVAAGAVDLSRPAELPPADYRGQQYVDSRGCMFMRAGQAGEEVWIPRVSREGVPVCGNPPSGRRVPLASETGATTAAPAATPTEAAPEAASAASGGDYLVAVGSFGVAANADKASARITAMGYPVARGRMQGASTTLVTVFAGPFATAEAAAAARTILRGVGFPDAIVMGP
jgi:cell division septation protein DedD